MRRLALLIILLFSGCASRHTLVQYSTISALMAGEYDGAMTFGELRRQGDFGLGTFNALDGEMIALKGRYYQVAVDGTVKPVGDHMRTPFAVVTFFTPTQSFNVSAANISELDRKLSMELTVSNAVYAIKITGTFAYLKTRSVPRQQPPYQPLVEAIKHQTVFELHNVTGTLVGFRCPQFLSAVNATGCHFHFITDDRRAGGHVLDCRFENGNVQIDRPDDLHIILPR